MLPERLKRPGAAPQLPAPRHRRLDHSPAQMSQRPVPALFTAVRFPRLLWSPP